MFTKIDQKILETIKQWFETFRLPTETVLIPIKIRPIESRHHQLSDAPNKKV